MPMTSLRKVTLKKKTKVKKRKRSYKPENLPLETISETSLLGNSLGPFLSHSTHAEDCGTGMEEKKTNWLAVNIGIYKRKQAGAELC